MKIRTKLYASIWISSLTTIIIAAGIIVELIRTDSVAKDNIFLNDVTKQIVSLQFLTYDYIQRPLDRKEAQWHETYDGLNRYFQKIRSARVGRTLIPDEVLTAYQSVRDAFEQLAENMRRLPEKKSTDVTLIPDIQNHLSFLLITKNQELYDWILQACRRSNDRLLTTMYWNTAIFLVLLGGLAVSLGSLLYIVSRGLLWSLVHLQKGVDAISRSDLNYRIPILAQDELGELSVTFNRMTDELQKLYTTLQESETNFRTFFETMTDMIIVGTPNGCILFTNAAVTQTLGYTPDDLKGMHLLDVHPADKRVEVGEIFAAMFRGEREYCPLPLAAKSGALIPVETRVWFGKWDGADCVFGICKNLIAEQEAQQRFERLFRHNPASMALSTLPDGRFMDVNDAFLKVSGYTRDEVIGNTTAELGFFPDSQRQAAVAENLRVDGRISNVELPIRCKDGAIIDGIFSGEAISSQGQQYFLTVMIDITDRKQGEEELRFKNLLLSTQQEVSIDGILVVDEDAKILSYNQRFIEMWGVPAKLVEDEIDEPVLQFVTAQMADPRTFLQLVQYLYENRHETSQDELVLVDGRVFDRYSAPMFGPDERYYGRIWYFRDITERKRVVAEKERLALAIEQAAETIVITNAEGTIQYVNPAFERTTGYTPAEAIGQNPRILKSGKQDDAFYKMMWDTLVRGEIWSGHLVNMKKNGELYTENATISPVRDASGNTINYVAVKRDITNELTLDEQFRQVQKMEAVGRLAGGVAHDFNNMLGVILGYIEMAMLKVDPSQPLHADLDEIRKAAARSVDLVRQLLAFARKQIVAPKVLDLNEAIADMLKMLQRLIGEDINLSWQPGANLWLVKIDPSQIDQILANLCINARDAITDVGKVAIMTANSTFDEDYCAEHAGFVPGEYVRLAVSDNGCGMDKETLALIFEPFFTTKDVGKGTGLGLASIYGAVKQNNGFINAYSEPGLGTTFTIYLPRHSGNTLQARTEDVAEPVLRGHETILLAEDEPAILRLITVLLEKQGYTVVAASTPDEAIRLAREYPGEIHLLITDVIMPEMNGCDLAKNLLSGHPHLKRLFMSGYTADAIAHHSLLDEGVYFIQKPFSIKDLAAKVREALE